MESNNTAPVTTQKTGMSYATVLFLVAIVAVVGFIAGTRSDEIMARIGPVFGVRVATGELDLSSTQQVYRQLKANFDGDLDEAALINGASRGLVEAVGDAHTVFMDSSETARFNDELNGKISGIGAEIGVRGGVPTVLRVIPSSPAERAGLKARDKIIGVNDTVTTGLDAARTAELIRGPAGTTVKVIIVRGNEQQDFTITRASITDSSVDGRVEDGVGILKVRRFDSDTTALARAEVEKMLAQDIRAVVLDLRDNGGGLLDQAQALAGLWLDNQIVVTEKGNNGLSKELRSTGRPILAGVPTKVLINGGSASASEIVAGALKDHGKAELIGETTFGKGTVQQLITLGNDTMLKVTIARWFTPNGNSIEETGIAPDIKVELTAEDLDADKDPQLQRAFERLR